ncbi:MAG: hypothetical protein KGL35_22590 [Bradyrhizobium sp.]|nr:hypothetical protein [Bradyrhizobium sp.]
MSIDHGILNTPLSRRSQTLFGETRAQFDRRTAMEAKRTREQQRAFARKHHGERYDVNRSKH